MYNFYYISWHIVNGLRFLNVVDTLLLAIV